MLELFSALTLNRFPFSKVNVAPEQEEPVEEERADIKERVKTLLNEIEIGPEYNRLNMGDYYFEGEGVNFFENENTPEDYIEALEELKESLEEKLPTSQSFTQENINQIKTAIQTLRSEYL